MPETTPAPSSRRPTAWRCDEPQPLARALVVDQDQETLAFAGEALSSFTPGLEVATARDLQQAWAWVETFQPQIIFVSEALAAETLKHLDARSEAVRFACTIVLMSGEGGDDRGTGIDPARIDLTLPKPLQLQPLLGAVRAIVKTRGDHS